MRVKLVAEWGLGVSIFFAEGSDVAGFKCTRIDGRYVRMKEYEYLLFESTMRHY
jgi:hypothetical protein